MNEVATSDTPDEKEPATGFVGVGVTEPIKRILNCHNVYVAQKPFQTLRHIFAKPKDPITNEQLTDGFYSIPCNGCDHKTDQTSVWYTFKRASKSGLLL